MSFPKYDKIRVLVVDDSSFMRLAISSTLSRDPEIEVVGTATDGLDGIEKALQLKPDVITMDIEMPRMNGISALKEIMVKSPAKVLMVSTQTTDSARATFEALEAGAVDFVPKNPNDSFLQGSAFRSELLRKVKGLSLNGSAAKGAALMGEALRVSSACRQSDMTAVAIGASTGGPVALQEVLSRIPADFPHPIVAGIHMPKLFTRHYAEHLNAKCPLEIREAMDGDLLQPGRALICPGGMHTIFIRQRGKIVVSTPPATTYPQYVYVPSIDLMLLSLTDACNGSVLGVILTGMGNDGFKGMQHLKSRGGITLVQDEATSTIYGMPRACVTGGVADTVLPLERISYEIVKIAG